MSLPNGEVIFNGRNIYQLSRQEMREVRKDFQMIFQDPYASLNPRMTVEEIISEPMEIHKVYKSSKERRNRVMELLNLVGLNEEHALRFPHEFQVDKGRGLELQGPCIKSKIH